MKNLIILSLLYFFYALPVIAQQAATTTGSEISGKGGTMSYTVGQVACTPISDLNGYVSQGVQQPFELFDIESSTTTDGITFQCEVFPNPTTNHVILSIKGQKLTNFRYMLYDTAKKLIKKQSIEDNETIIPMDNLPTGVYLLAVINPQRNEYKIFKIIKDNTSR
jgi:hypothetical protein